MRPVTLPNLLLLLFLGCGLAFWGWWWWWDWPKAALGGMLAFGALWFVVERWGGEQPR